jgi:hypothetical protein
MLLFFILGYLGLSGFLVLGLMWARHKGDSVQIRPAPDDTPRPPEHHPAPAPRRPDTATSLLSSPAKRNG